MKRINQAFENVALALFVTMIIALTGSGIVGSEAKTFDKLAPEMLKALDQPNEATYTDTIKAFCNQVVGVPMNGAQCVVSSVSYEDGVLTVTARHARTSEKMPELKDKVRNMKRLPTFMITVRGAAAEPLKQSKAGDTVTVNGVVTQAWLEERQSMFLMGSTPVNIDLVVVIVKAQGEGQQ